MDWELSSPLMENLPADGERPSPELWERGTSLPFRVVDTLGGPVAAKGK